MYVILSDVLRSINPSTGFRRRIVENNFDPSLLCNVEVFRNTVKGDQFW